MIAAVWGPFVGMSRLAWMSAFLLWSITLLHVLQLVLHEVCNSTNSDADEHCEEAVTTSIPHSVQL